MLWSTSLKRFRRKVFRWPLCDPRQWSKLILVVVVAEQMHKVMLLLPDSRIFERHVQRLLTECIFLVLMVFSAFLLPLFVAGVDPAKFYWTGRGWRIVTQLAEFLIVFTESVARYCSLAAERTWCLTVWIAIFEEVHWVDCLETAAMVSFELPDQCFDILCFSVDLIRYLVDSSSLLNGRLQL